jgi:competence protein ComEC
LGERIQEWVAEKTGDQSSIFTFLPTATLAVMGILAVVVWRAALTVPDGRLHLTFIDVGSGDALLIQTPTGRNLLVDGGPSPSKLSDGLGRRLPITHRQLDFLVVAAAGDGQIDALPRTLERFPPHNVLWAGPTAGTHSARELRKVLAESKTPVIPVLAGHVLELGEGARLQVLSAGSRGAVILLEWGAFRALLPIGLDFESMEELQNDLEIVPVAVMLLAESGYAPLNPPEWIDRWNPQLVVLSVAVDDRDGLPNPETLEAVTGYSLLRTDLNGWIHLSTDGEQMWVEVERR